MMLFFIGAVAGAVIITMIYLAWIVYFYMLRDAARGQ